MESISPLLILDTPDLQQNVIDIMPGNPGDINSILFLNQKYLLNNVPAKRRCNGFIKIPYSFGQITNIINRGELVVAKNGDEIIGYYLIGSTCKSEALNYQKEAVIKFAKQNGADPKLIAYGLQICIDEPFHKSGLFFKMTELLVNNAKMKYDYFLCSISDENTSSLAAHIKMGWKIIDKTDTTNFLIYETSKLLS